MQSAADKAPYHNAKLPDPKGFNGHFGDMDADGDELVNWEEFKAHFPKAVPEVFQAIDLNKDEGLDHDEWHEFKEAHGMRHHE